ACTERMRRFIAFLRAINVGGRNLTMAELRAALETPGISRIETFIASGNVIFEADARDSAALKRTIESRLAKSLGYEVATFVRTDAEVAAIAQYLPFSETELESAITVNVAFLAEPMDAAARAELDEVQDRDR
ncbi:MAG: DUF1697 domain-containing protein, partial [Verrucomicrobiota bacterium]|nr:DUF1697 domain-containing protein [Verrucomicrobiota bacterium]